MLRNVKGACDPVTRHSPSRGRPTPAHISHAYSDCLRIQPNLAIGTH
ncbi:hypothetical protein BALAC2494_01891 [Bifidobacterium animalis subsp. lactis CNCM I-2494]|uniref:Uncharacterized protein n=1 Tax=Bifidobacterium animalis subsp. lactis CNCM I-2494 TaxID=1042403 RepID=A0A806FNL7_BIFAN|nr:hypothetical protein BALAC2494_01891 [Bifidobacterium animalis subsp. lactis CNCM I-2494]